MSPLIVGWLTGPHIHDHLNVCLAEYPQHYFDSAQQDMNHLNGES